MPRGLPEPLVRTLLALGVAALTMFSPAMGAAVAAEQCATPVAVAESLWLIRGAGGAPSASNGGRVANSVLIAAPQGVIVVDPGPTLEAGTALRCALRRLALPDTPIALIFTHPHPENVLGSNAFPDLPVFAAATAVAAMKERCEHCRAHLARALGKDLSHSTPVIPNHPVAEATDIVLGGLGLRLIPLGAAHSPGDLAIYLPALGILIGGDVATVDELPDLHDGNLDAWITALDMLHTVGATLIIPGRGEAISPARLDRSAAYLVQLRRDAETAVRTWQYTQALPIAPQAEEFHRFRELHPLNSQHALREAEARWWEESPTSAQ